ncbi:unnamed protein product [Prorocentrum cordatum]|uniref:Thiamine pyrimidine synthase n=1 Tax=Prorocentrum cordatum TaxID=2364126 RepID=A0ABN9WV69_9DINO|nr:unnamed protein product [Polarella glacialis]
MSGRFNYYGDQALNALSMWKEKVDADDSFPYNIMFSFEDDESTSSLYTSKLGDMLIPRTVDSPDVVICPYTSGATKTVCDFLDDNNLSVLCGAWGGASESIFAYPEDGRGQNLRVQSFGRAGNYFKAGLEYSFEQLSATEAARRLSGTARVPTAAFIWRQTDAFSKSLCIGAIDLATALGFNITLQAAIDPLADSDGWLKAHHWLKGPQRLKVLLLKVATRMSDTRKLKANGSGAEAPERKTARVDEKDDDLQVDESAPDWAQSMQRMMIKMMGTVNKTATDTQTVKLLAQEAKDEATAANAAVTQVSADVENMKKELPSLVRDIVKGEGLSGTVFSSTAAGSAAKGKGKGKSETVEKLNRTMNFGTFPQDTKSADIVKFLEEVVKEAKEVEEVFAYGRKFAERGAVRFKTPEAMWDYLKSGAASSHAYQEQKIYGNADYRNRDPESDEAKRERAVRKLVRAIIEVNGGDGSKVKEHIDTNYRKGVVWWKECRAGEWRDGSMHLLGPGTRYQAKFDELHAVE